MNIYTFNPITRFRVRPYTDLSSLTPSNQINLVSSPGEYVPATFVLSSSAVLNNVLPVSSNLIGSSGTINADNIDLKIVKCWYQRGECIYPGYSDRCTGYGNGPPYYHQDCNQGDMHMKCLLPELLLNDDDFVHVDIINQDEGENFLWRLDKPGGAGYENVSIYPTGSPGGQGVDWEINDATTLQPTSFGGADNENKQYWITVHIPSDALPGEYTGNITVNANGSPIGMVSLSLTVLPFTLPTPLIRHGLYYMAKHDPSWPNNPYKIGCVLKTLDQLQYEYDDMVRHGMSAPLGIINPVSIYMPYNLDAAQQAGHDMSIVIVSIPYTTLSDGAIDTKVSQFRDLVYNNYGTTSIYCYDKDEQDVSAYQHQADRVRANSTSYCTCGTANANGISRAWTNINVLDLIILQEGFATQQEIQDLIDAYHDLGKLVGSYANPQVGEEKPRLFRQNYGLYLWQHDYDFAFDFAYQYNWGNPWNDWDWSGGTWEWKQHMFTYPTTTYPVGTIQFEGYREGATDLKYLTKLIQEINLAKIIGKDTTDQENYLNWLKTVDLRGQDLDDIRDSIINHISFLLSGDQPTVDDSHLFTITVIEQ